MIPEKAKMVFEGRFFDVYHWEQLLYDKTTRTFECGHFKYGSVLVIPVTAAGDLIISRQEQPSRGEFYSFVGGVKDPGETPEETSRRELLEEIGAECDQLELWWIDNKAFRVKTEVCIYIARNTRILHPKSLDGGEKIQEIIVSFDEFMKKYIDLIDYSSLTNKFYIAERNNRLGEVKKVLGCN